MNLMKQIRVLVVGERPLIVQGLALVLAEDERFTVRTRRRYSSREVDVDVVVVDLDDQGATQSAIVGQTHPPLVVVADEMRQGRAASAYASAAIVTSAASTGTLIEAVAVASSGGIAELPVPMNQHEERSPLDQLTPREFDVLVLLGDGLSGEAVASRLGITHNTVRTHVRNACATLGVRARRDALAMVADHCVSALAVEAKYERPAFGRSGVRSVELIARQGLRRSGLEAALAASAGLVLTCVHEDISGFLAGWTAREVDVAILDAASDGALESGLRLSEVPDLPPFLVLGEGTDRSLMVRAFLRGASGFVSLAEPSTELASAVHSVASGDGYVPRGMLGKLIGDLNDHWASRSEAAAAQARLSNRERAVMDLLSQGMREQEIAAALFVSPSTVRSHVQSANRKVGKESSPTRHVSATDRAGYY